MEQWQACTEGGHTSWVTTTRSEYGCIVSLSSIPSSSSSSSSSSSVWEVRYYQIFVPIVNPEVYSS